MRLANKFVIFAGGGAVLLTLFVLVFFTSRINGLVNDVDKVHELIQQEAAQAEVSKEQVVQKEKEFKALVDDKVVGLVNGVLIAAFIAITIFVVALVYITKIIMAPLNEAVEFSNSLARGDFSKKLKSTSRDEIGGLIKSLNYMRNRLEHSISKLKVSHEREKQARKEAESANNIKSDFIANISHELKNPLNSIIGISSLVLKDIERGVMDEELGDKIRVVLTSSELLNELISSLLELSKLGKEDVKVNIQDVNPSDFLRDVIDSCSYLAERKSISINSHYSASLPAEIKVDRQLLMNTLKKLVANAIRVSVIGGIIEVSCDIDERNIIFKVKDSSNLDEGAVSLAELFRAFIEASGDLDINQGFQGVVLLNLTIAAANAQILEAQITGELDADGNSVFTMIIPVVAKKQEGQSTPSKPTHTATNLKKMEHLRLRKPNEKEQKKGNVNILMAEDNEANRMLIELIFRRTNYSLECVDDGVTCLEVLKRKNFDLLLLDLQMPRLDGYDVLKTLRDDEQYKNMPVIILTAYMEEGDHDKLFEAGANDYLLKPIDVDELLEKVRAFVG